MNLTLHITSDCNFRCGYCYYDKSALGYMDYDTARKAVDFGVSLNKLDLGVVFFGGEPLLHKQLIFDTMDYCKSVNEKTKQLFHYKITTNGSLLDEEFVEKATDYRLSIALSIDGVSQAHDFHRKFANNGATHDLISEKTKLLLRYQKYSPAYMTVTPETVKYYYDSVEYLFDLGFKYIISSLNYAGDWDDSTVAELTKQYKKIARLYEKKTAREDKFYLSPFEMKLESYLKQNSDFCSKCVLAERQISLNWNGKLYPCVQFVDDKTDFYCIGTVDSGIDLQKMDELKRISIDTALQCNDCALNVRCNNTCSCLNRQVTGDIRKIPEILCESERALIPIIDKLGESMYKKRLPMFIQKHYNSNYPILSMIEDKMYNL